MEPGTLLLISAAAKFLTSAGARATFAALDSHELVGAVFSDLVSAADPVVTNWISSKSERLGLKKATRQTLQRELRLIDLLGIAWCETLSTFSEVELQLVFSETDARSIWRKLDSDWFSKWVHVDTHAGFSIAGLTPEKQLDDTLQAVLVEALAQGVEDEVQIAASAKHQIRPLLRTIVARLPDATSDLVKSLPSYAAWETRFSLREITVKIDAIASHVDGTLARSQSTAAQIAYTSQWIAELDGDVFRRNSFHEAEPPKLPLKVVYVEPTTIDGIGSQRTPALTAIGHALASGHPTILTSPFGRGKSLTCRMLWCRMAEAWIQSRDLPFPILIDCPEVGQSTIKSISEAAFETLRSRTKIDTNSFHELWNRSSIALIIDSFDEVDLTDKERRNWLREIAALAKQERFRIIVAGRPEAFAGHHEGETRILMLSQFDDDAVDRWLENVRPLFSRGTPTRTQLRAQLDQDVLRTPVLLLMATWIWDPAQARLPFSGKTQLYREFINRISRGKLPELQKVHEVVEDGIDHLHELAKRTRPADSEHGLAFRETLEILAWEILCSEQGPSRTTKKGIEASDIRRILEHRFGELSAEERRTIPTSILFCSFLGRSEETNRVAFTHKSFREYLCAEHFCRTLSRNIDTSILETVTLLLARANRLTGEVPFIADILRESQHRRLESILAILDTLTDQRSDVYLAADVHRSSQVPGSNDGYVVVQQDTRPRHISRSAEAIACTLRGYPMPTRPARGLSLRHSTITNAKFCEVYGNSSIGVTSRVAYARDTGEHWLILQGLKEDFPTNLVLNLRNHHVNEAENVVTWFCQLGHASDFRLPWPFASHGGDDSSMFQLADYLKQQNATGHRAWTDSGLLGVRIGDEWTVPVLHRQSGTDELVWARLFANHVRIWRASDGERPDGEPLNHHLASLVHQLIQPSMVGWEKRIELAAKISEITTLAQDTNDSGNVADIESMDYDV